MSKLVDKVNGSETQLAWTVRVVVLALLSWGCLEIINLKEFAAKGDRCTAQDCITIRLLTEVQGVKLDFLRSELVDIKERQEKFQEKISQLRVEVETHPHD